MIIVILTNDRKPNYIYKCIASVRKEYKGVIHLMISGDDAYLSKYTNGFIKHKVDQEGLVENWRKACKGYASCLHLGIGKGVLIIEDDTTFKKGWFKKFEQFNAIIHDKYFVISLGDSLPGSVQNPDIKIPSVQRFLYRVNLTRNPGNIPNAVIQCWHDSHAVYYPSEFPHEDLANNIEHFGVKNASMHDLIIGYYLFRKLYPIYITIPRLANNVGAHNSSVGRIEGLNSDYSDWDYDK